jgi:hypothetical protein
LAALDGACSSRWHHLKKFFVKQKSSFKKIFEGAFLFLRIEF